MTSKTTVDAARVELLLNELRLRHSGAVLRCVRDVALSGWWKSSP